LLNVYTPGGIDKFFLAVGIPIHSSTEQPQIDLAAYNLRTKPLREKTGIIRLGPPKYPEPSQIRVDEVHDFPVHSCIFGVTGQKRRKVCS
jgi:hypothetical protein